MMLKLLLLLCVVPIATAGLHRRLQNDRNIECPEDSVWHCENPFRFEHTDVFCDPQTCEWEIDLFDPDLPPENCRAIRIRAEFAGQNLPDAVEPCLLWQMTYGDLKPTLAPSISAQPSMAPSIAPQPTGSPSVSSKPSDVPSKVPSILPSALPSLSAYPSSVPSSPPSLSSAPSLSQAPSTAPPTVAPTISVAPSPTPPTTSPSSLPTYVAPGVVTNLSTLLVTFAINNNNNRRRQLSNENSTTSWTPLLQHHYLVELRRLLGVRQVHEVQLQTTTVQRDRLSNGTLLETLALDGAIVWGASLGEPNEPEVWLDSVWQGASAERLLAKLPGAVGLYVGLPSDYKAELEEAIVEQNEDDDPVFEWNLLWIAILAGGGAALLGVAVVVIVLCRRRRRTSVHELQTKEGGTIAPSGSGGDPMTSVEADASGTAAKDLEAAESEYGEEDSRIYPQSDVTSVYSYIENNTVIDSILGDQNYSMAPSVLYDKDDETVQSKMWSVMDGLDQSVVQPKDQGSPSRMVVGSSKRDNFMIFADSDDDLSLVSEKPLLANVAQRPWRMESMTDPEEPQASPMKFVDQKKTSDWTTGDYSPDENIKILRKVVSDDSGDVRSPDPRPNSRSVLSPVEESLMSPESSSNGESLHEKRSPDSVMAADSFMASDDDSSLFMGPEPDTKGSKKIQELSADNRVDSGRDFYRVDPATRGRNQLSEKEKEQLRIGRANPVGQSDDDSSIQIPGYQALHDDSSVSTSGTSARNSKYPIASMSSF